MYRTSYLMGFIAILFAVPFIASAATVSVSANDTFFAPKTITITVGDTVVWKNNGATTHTVMADGGAFDSGSLSSGQSFAYTFNAAGTYPYYCKPHGGAGGVGMAGTVVVAAAGATQTIQQTSSGVTADVLRAQIEDLLRRISTLQQQITAAGGPSPIPTSGAGASQSMCPRVGVTLRPGSSGEDVTRLQQFLARDLSIYPERLITGHYGALTEAAVARWQVKHNVVTSGSPDTTGYGQYGPRTAALMALECQNGSQGPATQAGGFIRVSPISGAAPLGVAVETTINTTRSCGVATYTVTFGDGTNPVNLPVIAGTCAEQKYTLSHVYQYGGIYTITLSSSGHRTEARVVVSGTPPPSSTQSCPGDIAAAQADAAGKICTQVVTDLLCAYNSSYAYSAPNGCQSEFLKARGWKVIKETTPTTEYGGIGVSPDPNDEYALEVTFDVGSCDGYNLEWGDGDTGGQAGRTQCTTNSISEKTLSHTYAEAGTYVITLTRGSQEDSVAVGIVVD